MNWRTANIKPGELFKVNITYYTTDFTLVKPGTVAMIIDLETIAGNVSYLIEDKKYRMDASSFLIMFERIAT